MKNEILVNLCCALGISVFVSCNSSTPAAVCEEAQEVSVEGKWLQPVPGMEGQVQGFVLQAGGKAESVGMATLLYDSWQQCGDTLLLSGRSIGNGQTIEFCDTLLVETLAPDSLVLRLGELQLSYSRGE